MHLILIASGAAVGTWAIVVAPWWFLAFIVGVATLLAGLCLGYEDPDEESDPGPGSKHWIYEQSTPR